MSCIFFKDNLRANRGQSRRTEALSHFDSWFSVEKGKSIYLRIEASSNLRCVFLWDSLLVTIKQK